jgi:hypothetical protein
VQAVLPLPDPPTPCVARHPVPNTASRGFGRSGSGSSAPFGAEGSQLSLFSHEDYLRAQLGGVMDRVGDIFRSIGAAPSAPTEQIAAVIMNYASLSIVSRSHPEAECGKVLRFAPQNKHRLLRRDLASYFRNDDTLWRLAENLRKTDCLSLGDLVQMSEAEIVAAAGCGGQTIALLQAALAEVGLGIGWKTPRWKRA